jgi:dihydrofolate reductase
MKITLFMTMSLNGNIARKNGSEDFLPKDGWIQCLTLLKKTKFLIWGRKTYESLKKLRPAYIEDLKETTVIIVTHKKIKDNNIISAKNPADAIKIAKKLGAKEAILSGGSSLNKSFLKNNLVNKIIIDVNPILIGEGIPLAAEERYDVKLKLEKILKKSEIVQITYKVLNK